jgi:hypothetical protein
MPSWFSPLRRLSLSLAFLSLLVLPTSAEAQSCPRVIHADVVAFDQVFFWNRLGAIQPQGQMFALRHDVMPISGNTLSPGNVRLRPGKRPRPLVLRMNVGDCMIVYFENLLASTRRDGDQSATRAVSIHAVGMQWIDSPQDDGSYVGINPNSTAAVGQTGYYTLYAEREGEHLLHSLGAPAGGQGDGAQLASGLFGAIIVEPAGSRWFRSQVTREDLGYAITGTSSYGLPIIDYEAVFPAGHPRAGLPVLEMLTPMFNGGKILYSDLTAIIAGPHPIEDGAEAGRFDPGTFPPNVYTLPDREQAFREFVTIYHDEVGAVQAFREFYDPVLEHTLHSGRDAFAINYGTAGIGAEVLANRLGLGPMWDCNECKYEEFFLSSWVVGDPAMVVDVPANTPCGPQTTSPNTIGQDPALSDFISDTRDGDPCLRVAGPKATKAFFPDDPSNVYHGYLNDHTRFRVLHAGPKEHHIHHLHAHQWLYTADSDKSSYLDSQAIGPGGSFTAEIAYNGAGNLNRTPGDSIFHCHFYPHFAQGMWALWRVHDVFERGTILDENGRPAAGDNRALPDGEIAQGTPIPGVVPLPGRPMPPMPKATVEIQNGEVVVSNFSAPDANPGFPFFVPGNAGHRPPSPPLDIIDDGGLPRHIIVAGTYTEAHTRLDFHKDLLTAQPVGLAANGTTIELRAMDYHSIGFHETCYPDGTCGDTFFETNGRTARRGAPFAPPCTGPSRTYKGADIQDDVKLNKAGWHFPQQRFSVLWDDVDDYLGLTLSSGGATSSGATKRPPEPLFFRANSGDCIEYQFTNLVPNKYELDDFQVLSPTDILGQHIHLVKFDVLASDGAANGFNYEDGSFSPDEVRERINAIRAFNSCTNSDPRNGTIDCPVAEVHPFFGAGPDKNSDGIGDWVGAQTTAQLWWADPVRDNEGNDRTLRTVFTHDHFGPSTHQQAGLYAGLVVEPAGSTWYHNETGTQLGTRTSDGGPTSWQAVIEPGNGEPPYREFLLELGDFQLAYEADNNGFPDPNDAINAPGREEVGIPDLLLRPQQCPGGVDPPCPELVSADDPGTMSVNYRNEPIALRVRNPGTNGQAGGTQGDLSFAFQSIQRADASLNTQPGFYQPLTNDVGNYDPYTPLLRAYENDRVQIRVLVGSHEEGHNFSIHGVKWLFEPSEPSSGYRGSQMMGISEHFEFIIPQLIKNPQPQQGGAVDRLWMAGSSTDDLWNGMWGLLRAYTGVRPDLHRLSNNQGAGSGIDPGSVGAFTFSCPKDAPIRTFDVSAIAASQALPNGRLTYNSRTDGSFGPLFDPTSLVYVRTADLDANDDVIPGLSIRMEPLILRAAAGECIQLTLRNKLPETPSDLPGYNTLPMIVEGFNANDIVPSHHVGLHPQLLYYDVSRYDGANVGRNQTQTVPPGQSKLYEWYAGDVFINSNGTVTATPVEFGGLNLVSSDRIEHASKGAFGALIIEPEDAFISEDNPLRRSEALITAPGDNDFREIVLMFQNDVNMRSTESAGTECFPGYSPGTGQSWPVENLGCMEDPEDSGQKAVNFRTEPLWKRMQHAPGTDFADTDDFTDWWDVLANVKVGGDPVTPVYEVGMGTPVRVRLLMAGGHSRNLVFALHGHIWDKEPWVNNSTKQGQNGFSFWEGARIGHGPSNHFDALLRNGAGGAFSIYGDYLFRDQVSTGLDGGIWGIIRVTE